MFIGTGRTFGGAVVKDKSAKKTSEPSPVERKVVFYRNGFVISGPASSSDHEDSSSEPTGEMNEFHQYDTPESKEFIENVTNGYAPLKMLRVKRNQPVNLNLDYKHGEDWDPNAARFGDALLNNQRSCTVKPFSGQGQSLSGAPSASKSSSTSSKQTSQSNPEILASSKGSKGFPYDHNKPKTTILVKCIDGTRLSVEVNLDTTLKSIYDYIADCTQMKLKSFILFSTIVPHLDKAENFVKTVNDLGISNSVLIQKAN